MTQFALAHMRAPIADLVVPNAEHDRFSTEIVKELFPTADLDDIYVIDVNGKNIDELMTDAQRSLIMQSDFGGTELVKVMKRLIPAVEELVFWYGSDYDDLDEVHDTLQVLRGLESAVSVSTCEAYLRYRTTV